MQIKRQSDDPLTDAAESEEQPEKVEAPYPEDARGLSRQGDLESTPRNIVDHYRRLVNRGELGRSRSGITELVRVDLGAYHLRRGWHEPTDEQVQELVREIL